MTDLPLKDQLAPRTILDSELAFEGRVWNIVRDRVDLGGGETVTRDYVAHPGAVGVMAVNEHDEVYLLRQYRHPVRRDMWEPPAGLLDVPGEDPLVAAKRELWEEADLIAGRWDVLLDVMTSPGGSAEAIRLYVAREISDAPLDHRFARTGEERDMPFKWIPIADALAAVLRGDIGSPTTVSGIFALDTAMRAGWSTVRPVDAPWIRP